MSLVQEMLHACKLYNIPTQQAYSNFALYIQLIEVKKLWDVSWICDEKLGAIYCKARKVKDGDFGHYIPVSCYSEITVDVIENWQAALKCDTITMVMCSSDSTCVYYEFTKGLIPPESALEIEARRTDFIPKQTKILMTEAMAKKMVGSPSDEIS